MRCKLCCRFYNRNFQLCKNDKQLAAIYDANFKEQVTSRRAFIIRSHKLRDGNVSSWIKRELHAMSSERNSLKCTTPPDALQTTHKLLIRLSTDGPTFHHNYTEADMNPVATFTQEHPHWHLARYNLSMMPPCHPAMYNQPPHVVPPQRCLTRSAVIVARHIYNPPTTPRTCGLVAFRTKAANTSTRKCPSCCDSFPRPKMLCIHSSGGQQGTRLESFPIVIVL